MNATDWRESSAQHEREHRCCKQVHWSFASLRMTRVILDSEFLRRTSRKIGILKNVVILRRALLPDEGSVHLLGRPTVSLLAHAPNV